MPVIITHQSRAGSGLKYKYYNFQDPNDPDNEAAAWYGFARFGLGKFGGKLNWVLLDEGQLFVDIVYFVPFGTEWSNVTYGLEEDGPCTAPFYRYNKAIIDWIYSRPDLFDSTKVFIEGFSKNGASAGKVVILNIGMYWLLLFLL